MKEKLTLGLAFCASFCTLKSVIALLPSLCEDYRVIPIFSETVRSTDTRFGKAEELMNEIVTLTGERPITSIKEAEPIGPEKRFDILAIAPCTGNTLAKLSHGIIDATVPMAVKAHLRNERPLVIALASNDALTKGLSNIAAMIDRKHCYFVPLGQDDPIRKPASLVADFTKLPDTLREALRERQLQPILLTK